MEISYLAHIIYSDSQWAHGNFTSQDGLACLIQAPLFGTNKFT